MRELNKNQAVFPYYDGERKRYADPFGVWRKLVNHPKFNMQEMTPLVEMGEEPETTICIEAVVEVFGIKRWNPVTHTGLTDMQVLIVLDRFDNFLGAIKKNFVYGSTSSPTTDLESSISPEPPKEATNSSSPSTSTSTEPNSAGV